MISDLSMISYHSNLEQKLVFDDTESGAISDLSFNLGFSGLIISFAFLCGSKRTASTKSFSIFWKCRKKLFWPRNRNLDSVLLDIQSRDSCDHLSE